MLRAQDKERKVNAEGSRTREISLGCTLSLSYRPSPHFPGGSFKRRFQSKNASNVFLPNCAGEIQQSQQSPFISTLCSRKTGEETSRDYCGAIRFQNGFRLHGNLKPTFSRAFSKSSFIRDGLVWMVDLTVGIKLCFQISLKWCGRNHRELHNKSLFEVFMSHLLCLLKFNFCMVQYQPKSKLKSKRSTKKLSLRRCMKNRARSKYCGNFFFSQR